MSPDPQQSEAPHKSASHRLATSKIIWFSLPQLAQGFALLPVVNYVPAFYADHKGLPLALVGLMLVASRLVDVAVDPMIGAWTDASKSRFGRRKPFIVMGIPIMLISAWFVFVPPAEVGPLYLFLGLMFLYIGFAFVTIAYAAWAAELSPDYDERSRISALRGGFSSVGSLFTLSIPVIMQFMGYDDIALVMMVMVVCFIILQPLTFALAMWKVSDRSGIDLIHEHKPARGKWSAIIANSIFLRLLGAIILLIIGMAVGATLNMIVFKHVAGDEKLFAPTVFVQNLVAIASIPLWLKLAKTLGKHRAIAIAMLSVAFFSALTFWVGKGDGLLLSALVVGIGVGVGAVVFLIGAMVADLVDRDLLDSGEERTGLYMAAAGMAAKLAGVVGVLLGTAVPGIAGFQPSDAMHDPNALLVLRSVYAFVCPILAVPAALMLWNYPLDRAAQEALRQAITAKRASL